MLFCLADLQAFKNNYTSSATTFRAVSREPRGSQQSNKSSSEKDGRFSKDSSTTYASSRSQTYYSTDASSLDSTFSPDDTSTLYRSTEYTGTPNGDYGTANPAGHIVDLGSGRKEAYQSLPLRVGIKITDNRTSTLVENLTSEEKNPQERFPQKIERHKRKKSPRKEHKRTTWLYKDDYDTRLYTQKQKHPNPHKNLHMNGMQFKQQRRYLERLANKLNELQKVQALLLSKLGVNKFTY